VTQVEEFLLYLLDHVTLRDATAVAHLKAVLAGTEDPIPDLAAPEGTDDVAPEPAAGAPAGNTPAGVQPAEPDQPAAPAGPAQPLAAPAGPDPTTAAF
jgi:hypothetical protein